MSGNQYRHVILLLGDQLSLSLACFDHIDKDNDIILMMEVQEEATYVSHHVHKIIFTFSAMRHFAQQLQKKGFQVFYLTIDDPCNLQSLDKNVCYFLNDNTAEALILTEPGEFRIQEKYAALSSSLHIPVEVEVDSRFYCSRQAFAEWAKGKNQLRMEFFYREMRKKTGILMRNGKPIQGKWNFDTDNRKPPNSSLKFPQLSTYPPDKITKQVIATVKKLYNDNMGDADSYQLAVTHADAHHALKYFVAHGLENFGTYQDAMVKGEYTLFHSQLSIYLNAGLLTPMEIIDAVCEAYQTNNIAINQVEGYIRQILGWREYMRGLYWLKMPGYKEKNYFHHESPLPSFYWTGETDMACMQHAITQTIETATSHHIQRLMITGNFALLIGVLPDAICEWYLAVYADAYEWVELPNTLGMSQFADGGIIASKPYISSGNYINKMSNFCNDCPYNVKEKFTDDACPYNYLYWAFLITHEKKLRKNTRLAFAYKHIDKMSHEDKTLLLRKKREYLASITQKPS